MDGAIKRSGIAAPSRPSAGRIHDYLLGGQHNFEVDRVLAAKALEKAPFLSQALQKVRGFLGQAVRQLSGESYDQFIDFASGLPVVDHIHLVARPGTRVIYSDIDPLTVAYAQEILGDNPRVRFLECDAGKPEELLESKTVQELFGTDRRAAIGFNGIAYFLSDATVKHALRVLYDWAGPGSKLFFSDVDANPDNLPAGIKTLFDLYAKMGQPMFARPQARLFELAKPWRIDAPGAKPLQAWLAPGQTIAESPGGDEAFYGVIFKK